MNIVMQDFFETGRDDKKANPDILEGNISRVNVDILTEYLSSVIESAVATLPEDAGFRYMGYRILTPMEDFYHTINASISKNIVDLSRNSLFKIELGFQYRDLEIKRILSLPYVDKGGLLKLSDATYALIPVLSSYPIAPSASELFIRLLRDKLIVKKMRRNIFINGIKTYVDIHHSRTYKLISKVNPVIPIALYPIIKYGINDAFELLLHTKPIFLFENESIDEYLDEYDVFQSLGVKPKALHANAYVPHEIRILVKKKDVTPLVKSFIGSLIYSFDMSPIFAMELKKVIGKKKDHNTHLTLDNIDEETLYWITLLGKIVFKNKYTLDRIQVDMLEHINILNNYLDNIIKERLKEIDIVLNDFYDLMFWSMSNFDEYVGKYESYSSNLANRYLDLPYYVLYQHIEGVNKAFLEFKRSLGKKELTEKDIHSVFNDFLSTKKIFGLISSSGLNLSLIPVDTTGDQYYWKITAVSPLQESGNGVIRSKREAFPLSIRKLKAEDLLYGSMFHLPKKTPSPKLRLNLTSKIDSHSGKILFSQQDKITCDKINAILNMKHEDGIDIELLENEIDAKDI